MPHVSKFVEPSNGGVRKQSSQAVMGPTGEDSERERPDYQRLFIQQRSESRKTS